MEKALDATNLPPGTFVYKWTVERKLAQGDFSFIYACNGSSNMSAQKQFALKCESAESPLQMLKVEAYVLQKISKRNSRHFCDIEDIGKFQGIHYIVMHMVGRALVDYVKTSLSGMLTVNCALSVGVQIVEALEDLHNCGFIHRDLKPSNICLGRKDRGESGKVYLLSFGISRKYLDSKKQIRKAREQVEFRGTVRYASLACHQLQELSRKDDLESALYVLAECLTGQLPWKGLPDGAAVAKVKQQSRQPPAVFQLFRGACPIDELRELMVLIDSYDYNATPDYANMYTILRRAIRRNAQPEHPYDWEQGGTNPLRRKFNDMNGNFGQYINNCDNLDEQISVTDFIKTLKKVESCDTLNGRESSSSSSSIDKLTKLPEDGRKVDKKASANDLLQNMRKRFVHRATEPIFHALPEAQVSRNGESSAGGTASPLTSHSASGSRKSSKEDGAAAAAAPATTL
ncbi:unnamed protein product [Caenorhabditis sp. 36 PRJEB53466]|nr:unnamed protein product [Caenorhabditis sp. 36 PRJEB53466]